MAVAKIAVGTVGVALAGVAGRAAAAANAAVAYPGVKIVAYSSRYKLGQAISIGGDIGIAFTGTLLVNGFVDSTSNHAKKDAALADCKAKSPQADHSVLRHMLANPL